MRSREYRQPTESNLADIIIEARRDISSMVLDYVDDEEMVHWGVVFSLATDLNDLNDHNKPLLSNLRFEQVEELYPPWVKALGTLDEDVGVMVREHSKIAKENRGKNIETLGRSDPLFIDQSSGELSMEMSQSGLFIPDVMHLNRPLLLVSYDHGTTTYGEKVIWQVNMSFNYKENAWDEGVKDE